MKQNYEGKKITYKAIATDLGLITFYYCPQTSVTERFAVKNQRPNLI